MKEFYKALAAFQYEVPIIHKDSKGYNYTYADLAAIIEKITPFLKKHNLGFYQQLNGDILKTVIFHTLSGENIESESSLAFEDLEYIEVEKIGKDKKAYKTTVLRGFDSMNIPQAKGALISYFRRYSLSCALGLVSDKDADARNKRLTDQSKELPTLHPDNKKDWNNIIKVLATKQYTQKQVETKWIIEEEHHERLDIDIQSYIKETKSKKDD